MTGKQFDQAIRALFGDHKTTELAAEALRCSKRTVERARNARKIRYMMQLAVEAISEKKAA